ncbi:hypothetical protein J4573_52635 [Actinomadura barringtoniae]|uniref:Uncharacterized protein n=1 Tax=Actinomadura barringtoniae TaxID=1427535 RepID=A0A939PNW2_9ACTN|nr:hypothetical protein [Actinomadura barringtoniae]MBO2455807.1 hypothetical protein [Actinomadura barringtoniae]
MPRLRALGRPAAWVAGSGISAVITAVAAMARSGGGLSSPAAWLFLGIACLCTLVIVLDTVFDFVLKSKAAKRERLSEEKYWEAFGKGVAEPENSAHFGSLSDSAARFFSAYRNGTGLTDRTHGSLYGTRSSQTKPDE